jgi:hypothetical protein
MNRIKMGIRCKTGAVPAAVNPICKLTDCVVELQKPLFPKKGNGKASTNGISQKTCHKFNFKIKLRDKKLEKYQRIFHSLSKAPLNEYDEEVCCFRFILV